MSETSLSLAFYASLCVCLPLGLALLVVWAKYVFTRAKRVAERTRSLSGIATGTTVLMLPGVLALALACVPCFYLGHQRKQLDYCVEVIRVNGLARAESMLQERCSFFVREELVQRAAPPR